MLTATNLHVHYPSKHGPNHAVRGVSFNINQGETLGLVGESGSGKTTTARTLLRLAPLTAGSITWHNESETPVRIDALAMGEKAFAPYRKKIAYVFQCPHSSLNPKLTIAQTLAEPLRMHCADELTTHAARTQRAGELLETVGLPADALGRLPGAFSGGQRQRIGIARALAAKPQLLICDEPVSALDVSVAAHIINLLQQLQETLGLSMLFIGHDLAVVQHISHNIAVMHQGEIVETGPAHTVTSNPTHPYTQKLLQAATLGV